MDKQVSDYMAEIGSKGGRASKPTSAANGAKGGAPKGKLIAKWSDDIKVGIWDNEEWTLRLYKDRAILHYPTVRWVNNSGSLHYTSERITGRRHASLLKIAQEQADDAADYTDRVSEIVREVMTGY